MLILRELARHAPTVFNVHVPAFIDAIWPALRDQSLAIREAAVRALRECLVVIEKRVADGVMQKPLEVAS